MTAFDVAQIPDLQQRLRPRGDCEQALVVPDLARMRGIEAGMDDLPVATPQRPLDVGQSAASS